MNTAFSLLVASALFVAADGQAQSYPAKLVRYVVPVAAGSGADVLGRIMADGLTQAFGRQVIVDNRAGAGANIGAEIVARAAPDGHTLLQVMISHAANVTLYRKLSYDVLLDFSPVTLLATYPSIVVVHPSLPVKSINELVRLAKANPGAINYASAGAGSGTFLATEMFKAAARVNLVNVPYRGSGEALIAVISGESPVSIAPVATTLPLIRQGKLRPLAVTSAQRSPLVPEYPTVAESGYPGYEYGNWFGLMVPVKTPKETIAAIHAAAVLFLKQPNVTQRLNELGYIVTSKGPDEFLAYLKSEIDRLAKIIVVDGATAD